jgi:hypothetical protein
MAEQFQNFFVTKLREACDATATTIYVDTVPSITEGTLVLEYANSTKHEIIHFTGVSGYGLTGCTRGLEGTTAKSHSAGTDVRQNLTAGMIDKIINGVITTENIANSAVTTAKINNGAVTTEKIANSAVTTVKINNGAVTANKIDFTTFSEAISSTTSSITLPAGKWALFYELQVYQTSATTSGVLTMTFTSASGMSATTWAVPQTSGQNFYSVITKCSIATVSTSTNITRTLTTQTNITLGSQKWVAIPIFK